jgi:hypothetical protein
MFRIVATSLLLTIALSVPHANAQRATRPEGPTYIDPKEAGPDFATQGEYVTDKSAAHPHGVHVVALGDGKFQVVVLAGGLPGDGWDGKGRVELKAAREGDSVAIKADKGFSGSIGDGNLSLTTPGGGKLALKKIERQSPRAGAQPPADATVLFDGTNTDAWQNGKIDDRHLLVDGARTEKKYQDFTMHVEYILPFKPLARDQERGNSGVYLQDRYEVQILDTFGHPAEFNGAGSMYRQHAPSVNMCYPPLQWQTYDIEFHAAKFDASGKKTQDAEVTLNHNGVTVQDHYKLTGKTGAGHPEGPQPGPIWLQDHHNPVFFRNVWIVEK